MKETHTHNVINALVKRHTNNMRGGLSNSDWKNKKCWQRGGKACPESQEEWTSKQGYSGQTQIYIYIYTYMYMYIHTM